MKTSDRIKQIQKDLTAKAIVDVGYPVFLSHTPVRSGNAKRHTSRTEASILADYPYARRLDQGWSHKSPEGMTAPTMQAMRAYVKKMIG